MASENNKKLSILYVLEILKEFSDESHLLTQKEILSKIKQVYGMECERKSISANIDALIDFGIEIIKIPHKGCYLADRLLEDSEVSFIIDSIFSNKSIEGKQARELARKVSSILSKSKQKRYDYVFKAEQVNRNKNKNLFLNIEMIQEAIENRKQISFTYIKPSFVNKGSNKVYTVNPYFLFNSQGRYYLICSHDCFEDTTSYKLDLISNIDILDKDIKQITKLKNFEKGFDISKFMNEHIYPFGKETIKAILKLSGEYATSFVIDWFGDNVRLFEKDESFYAEVESNEQALIYWCLQYCDHIELVNPLSTRKKINEKLKNAISKYEV